MPQEKVPVSDYKPVKTAIFIATYLQKTYFCLLNELRVFNPILPEWVGVESTTFVYKFHQVAFCRSF